MTKRKFVKEYDRIIRKNVFRELERANYTKENNILSRDEEEKLRFKLDSIVLSSYFHVQQLLQKRQERFSEYSTQTYYLIQASLVSRLEEQQSRKIHDWRGLYIDEQERSVW